MNVIRRFFDSIPALAILAVAAVPPSEGAEKITDLRGVFRVGFNYDASRVVAISREGALTMWELPAGTPVTGDLDATAPADGFVMSRDAKLVVVGFKDGRCRVFDAATAKAISPALDFRFNAEFEMPALFSPDGKTLLLFANKEAAAFEVPSGQRRMTIPIADGTNDEATGSAAFTADGAQCFVIDGSGNVTRYDTKNWKPNGPPMRHPRAEAAYHYGFSLSDDGKWLATYDDPGENGPKSNLQVWDATTGKAVGKPLIAVNGMTGRFVGNNRILVLPGRGEAAVRELPSLKIVYALRRHDDIEGPNARVSPDRKWILVWGADHLLDLVDTATGKLAQNYQAPREISKVLMAPDSSGCYLVIDNSAFPQEHYDTYVVKLGFPALDVTKVFRITDFVLGAFLSPDGKRLMVQQGGTNQERLAFFDAATLKPID